MKLFLPCRVYPTRFFLQQLRLFYLLVFGSVSSVYALAVSPFEEGNAHFKEGRYPEAEQAYTRSLASEGDTPSTRYNLGKIREALGDPGGAMLEWERALRLEPTHPKALKSLSDARAALSSRPDPEHWWLTLQPVVSYGKEHWLLATGAWLFLAGLCLLMSGKYRAEGLTAGLTGGMLFALGFFWFRHALAEADMALVKERSVVFRAAPADPARALEALNAGTRLQLLDESGGWCRCRLADGLVGWVPATSIERISLAK